LFSPNSAQSSATTGIGRTCVMLPLFQGGSNGAPVSPFGLNKKYPTIRGLLNIQGTLF